MYKCETHLHTDEVSLCGHVPAAQAVNAYIGIGYSTIVVSDHLSRYTYNDYIQKYPDSTWEEFVVHYASGYHAAKKAARGKISVLFCAEITFDADKNDFLVFGITEKFIKEHPNLMSMELKNFVKLAHAHRFLVFQAHPFRGYCTCADSKLLDGVEVYNGNPRHNSNNDKAARFASRNKLLKSSGSDYHQYDDLAHGGIITKEPITSMAQLKRILKSGEAKLIK